MINNLISLLDHTYPGAHALFNSAVRIDGSHKWLDFLYTYWHVDCVRGKTFEEFTEHYQKWCIRRGYNFSTEKARYIYTDSLDLTADFPRSANTRMLVRQAVSMTRSVSDTIKILHREMNDIAMQLPEYPVVSAMNGVGKAYASLLMAEIGDVTRFSKRESLTAFAGFSPGGSESGTAFHKGGQPAKKEPAVLKKLILYIMDNILLQSPDDDPVYDYMIKKKDQGKPHNVYVSAGANKFLRIYFGRVKEYLSAGSYDLQA